MRKDQIEPVKKLILRRFLIKSVIGMKYVNRQDVKVKQIGGDVVRKAIDELIKNGFLEPHKGTHHSACVSINPRMRKDISVYLERK